MLLKQRQKLLFLEHKCNSSISKEKSKREMELEEQRIDALNRKAVAQERIDELKNSK